MTPLRQIMSSKQQEDRFRMCRTNWDWNCRLFIFDALQSLCAMYIIKIVILLVFVRVMNCFNKTSICCSVVITTILIKSDWLASFQGKTLGLRSINWGSKYRATKIDIQKLWYKILWWKFITGEERTEICIRLALNLSY